MKTVEDELVDLVYEVEMPGGLDALDGSGGFRNIRAEVRTILSKPRRRPGGMSWDDMIDSLVKHAVDSVSLLLDDVECWDVDPEDFEPQDYVVRDDVAEIVRQALEDHGIDSDALHD